MAQKPFKTQCQVCGEWTDGTDGGMLDHDIGAVCGGCTEHAQAAEKFLEQAKNVLRIRAPIDGDKFWE